MTPFEYIYHYLRMRGYPREEARTRAREAIEEFEITYYDMIVSTLSGGMVRKTLLAMVLSADTLVYYLDEPTVGLDVENRLKLWNILRRRAKAGSTILVTSHYLNEISSICDKVLLIKDGRVAAFGEPEELGRRYLSGFRSKIVVFGEYSSDEHIVRSVGKNTVVYTRSKAEEREIIAKLENARLPFKVEELTIEDLFLVGVLG